MFIQPVLRWLRNFSANSPLQVGALTLLVLLSAATNVRSVRQVIWHLAPDVAPWFDVGDYERRFAPLLSALPRDEVLGYIGDPRLDPKHDSEGFECTRYVVTPARMVRNDRLPWVVANFPQGEPPVVPAHLQLVRDFGNGARLYRSIEVP